MREGLPPECSESIVEAILAEVCGESQSEDTHNENDANNADVSKRNKPLSFDHSKKIFLSDFMKLSSPLTLTRSSSFANDQIQFAATSISTSNASSFVSPMKAGAAQKLILK